MLSAKPLHYRPWKGDRFKNGYGRTDAYTQAQYVNVVDVKWAANRQEKFPEVPLFKADSWLMRRPLRGTQDSGSGCANIQSKGSVKIWFFAWTPKSIPNCGA